MYFNLVWPCFFIGLGYIAFQFADLDQLTSFADDGGNYLVMAQYLSPYADVSPLIENAYFSERYPPLFPLLLAVTGSAEDFSHAHQLIVFTFLVSCLLYAIWATRALGSQWLGLLACLIYVASPNVWPLLLRILSENFYLALTLAAMLVAEQARSKGGYWLLLLTILLTSVVLTRTIGITLVAAWGIYLFLGHEKEHISRLKGVTSLALPLFAAVSWYKFRQMGEDHLYHSEITWLIEQVAASPQPVLAFIEYLATQGEALLDSWLGALMLVWQPDINPRFILAIVISVMVFIGWFNRIRRNYLDAWYSLLYIGLIIVWPFPGQYFRFIVPLVPLFIVYALQAAQAIAGKLPNKYSVVLPVIAGIVFLSLSLPALMIIYQRSQHPPEYGLDFSSNPEFYQEADIRLAREKAANHLLLARDMDVIRERTPVDSTIMGFTPVYLNLLAEREGREFPNESGRDAMLAAITKDPPDYIYMSRLHPRKTSENGLVMLRWVGGAGVEEWTANMPGTQDLFSVMLRTDK